MLRQKILLLPPLQFRSVALLIIDKARGELLACRRPAPMLPAGPVDVGLPLVSLCVHRLPSCPGLRGSSTPCGACLLPSCKPAAHCVTFSRLLPRFTRLVDPLLPSRARFDDPFRLDFEGGGVERA